MDTSEIDFVSMNWPGQYQDYIDNAFDLDQAGTYEYQYSYPAASQRSALLPRCREGTPAKSATTAYPGCHQRNRNLPRPLTLRVSAARLRKPACDAYLAVRWHYQERCQLASRRRQSVRREAARDRGTCTSNGIVSSCRSSPSSTALNNEQVGAVIKSRARQSEENLFPLSSSRVSFTGRDEEVTDEQAATPSAIRLYLAA